MYVPWFWGYGRAWGHVGKVTSRVLRKGRWDSLFFSCLASFRPFKCGHCYELGSLSGSLSK